MQRVAEQTWDVLSLSGMLIVAGRESHGRSCEATERSSEDVCDVMVIFHQSLVTEDQWSGEISSYILRRISTDSQNDSTKAVPSIESRSRTTGSLEVRQRKEAHGW